MSFYADTSFLFSYYASDANSVQADAWRQVHPEPLLFTALHQLELRNAFELAVFQNRVTTKEAAELWAQVEVDLSAGLLVGPVLSLPDLFRQTDSLVEHHTTPHTPAPAVWTFSTSPRLNCSPLMNS